MAIVESTEFEEVICAWDWWDCPRSGVAFAQGMPHRFLCEFSEELDDYPDEFCLWAIAEDDLQVERAAWDRWVNWRRRFDRGEPVEPFEHDPNFAELRDRLQVGATAAPDAILAIPTWRLDPNRSFAEGTPKHWVRWRSADS